MSDDTGAARPSASAGDRIAGYRLEEQIGQGGMAVVYRAHDERLDRRVALKVLAPALAADTAFRTRFIRESRAAAAVDHPNIIPVYDAGDAGGALFISMRYVQGGDVRGLLVDGQPLPPARVWNIVTQVADALDAAHEHGLVHRDVKPANMLLDTTGMTGAPHLTRPGDESHDHVYLSDFGISKRTLASNLTSTGQFVGTLDYIAPEQVEGHGVDGRADQYSLACAAFELLSGVPPFRRSLGLALINAHLSEAPPSLTSRRAGLPAAVDAVLAKAMAKSPAQRYATCAAFALDLGRALGLAPGAVEAAGALASGPPVTGAPKPWPATALAAPPEATVARTPPPQAPAASSWQGQQAQNQPGQNQPGQNQPGQNQPGQNQPGQYQPGQYQPGQTPPIPFALQQPAPKRGRGKVLGILAGVLALALVGGGVAVVLAQNKNNGPGPHVSSPAAGSSSSPAGSSSSPPASTAQAQATAIGSLLQTSGATRGKLETPVADIQDNCSVLTSQQLGADVSTIKSVAMQRQAEYQQALGLQTNLLPSGAELKTDLLNALQYSLNADNDYLQWAQEEQSGCFPAQNSAAFNAAGTSDTQAVNAKTTFADLWDGIGPDYGQRTVQEQDI